MKNALGHTKPRQLHHNIRIHKQFDHVDMDIQMVNILILNSRLAK